MKTRSGLRKKFTSLLATGTAALVALGGMALAPTAATAAVEDGVVAGATLDWGIKSSFRNYLNMPFVGGTINTIGTTAQLGDGTFQWTSGAGNADLNGDAADVSFGASSGVHFTGHHGILDLEFTNPRIEMTSATAGNLYLDVTGREFIDTETEGPLFTDTDVHFANLTAASAPALTDGEVRYSGVAAKLTADGNFAFGGFYEEGTDLDPLNFTFPVEAAEVPATVTTTELSASAGPFVEGDEVELTASVSPANAEGTVRFLNGATVLGEEDLVDGDSTLTTTALPVGTNSITAEFQPNDAAVFTASASSAVTVTVEGVPEPTQTTTTLSASEATIAEGESVDLIAAIAPAEAAGSVEFIDADDEAVGAAVPVTDGEATTTLDDLEVGEHTFTADFTATDAALFTNSSSSTVTVTVEEEEEPVVWTPELEVFQEDGTTPIGDTELRAGDKVVVRGSGYDPESNVGGRGVPIPSNLSQGVYVVFGDFAPVWQPSTGAEPSNRAVGSQGWVLSETVLNQVPPAFKPAVQAQWVKLEDDGSFVWTATLQNPASSPAGASNFGIYTYGAGGMNNASQEKSVLLDYQTVTTATSLTVSDATAEYGDDVTLTANVAPVAAGTVQFSYGATANAANTPIGGPVAVSAGVAELDVNDLPVGAHFVKATFTSDAPRDFSGSISSTKALQVTPAVTAVALTATPTEADFGTAVTLDATVSPADAAGTVTFKNGEEVLGTETVAAGAASLEVVDFEAGNHSVTATFTPENSTNYAGAESNSVDITIEALPTTTTLAVSESDIELGETVELTAEVDPAVAGQAEFIVDGTVIGTVDVENGSASLSTDELTIGYNELTVAFVSGDANYLDSYAAPVHVTVFGATVNGKATDTVEQGETVEFAGGPFEEGEIATVTVNSDPVDLGEATIGEDGIAVMSWQVPEDFETGEHTVVFESEALTVSGAFNVVPAATDGGDGDDSGSADGADNSGADADGSNDDSAAKGSKTGDSKALSNTGGTDLLGMTVLASLLILAGAGAMVARRKATANK